MPTPAQINDMTLLCNAISQAVKIPITGGNVIASHGYIELIFEAPIDHVDFAPMVNGHRWSSFGNELKIYNQKEMI